MVYNEEWEQKLPISPGITADNLINLVILGETQSPAEIYSRNTPTRESYMKIGRSAYR